MLAWMLLELVKTEAFLELSLEEVTALLTTCKHIRKQRTRPHKDQPRLTRLRGQQQLVKKEAHMHRHVSEYTSEWFGQMTSIVSRVGFEIIVQQV